MLESAEVGHRISKEEYAREEPKLREALLMAQWDLSRSGHGPVLLIISGVEAGGRGETANKLTEWMDPRHIRVVAFGPRSGDELVRPLPWRYWRALPPKGRIGIFMNAWYNEALARRLSGKIGAERLELLLESIRHHERMLVDEGLVLLKFWIHLSKKDQKQRLERLEKDPLHALARHPPRLGCVAALQQVARHVGARVARVLERRGAVVRRRRHRRSLPQPHRRHASCSTRCGGRSPPRNRRRRHAITPPAPSVIDNVRLIRELDLSKTLPAQAIPARPREVPGPARAAHAAQALRRAIADPRFRRRRRGGQGRRDSSRHRGARRASIRDGAGRRAHRRRARAPVPVAILAARAAVRRNHDLRPVVVRARAGRARRRLLHRRRLDARLRRDQPVRGAADRRRRASSSSSGCRSARRSSCAGSARARRSRSSSSRSRADDWRNRKKWDAYEKAVCDMVDRTSTEIAPWTLVEADDKKYARVKILKTIVKRLEAALG